MTLFDQRQLNLVESFVGDAHFVRPMTRQEEKGNRIWLKPSEPLANIRLKMELNVRLWPTVKHRGE
jgi:hypothetical protein